MPDLSVSGIVPIVVGALLLFFGRKVFWLFVGAVVFIVVMDTAPRFVHHQESTIFYVALAAGVLAASAGYFVQKVALRVAGFLAGGFFAFTLTEQYLPQFASYWWVAALAGGIIGAVITSFLVEWALIMLSSIAGALLITQRFDLDATQNLAAFIALTLIGVVVQARGKRSKRDDR
jgi:hypothetical protein